MPCLAFPLLMLTGLTLVTPPAAAPITLADAKAHSRVDLSFDDDDALIAGYISSATIDCEDRVNRAFMPQQWRLALRNFPGRDPGEFDGAAVANYLKWNHIAIPKPPLVSIASFTYMDTDGNVFNMQQGYGSQVGNYLLDLEPEPGRIVLPFSGIWPTTILLPGSPIKITFNCGYPAFSGMLNLASDGTAGWESGDKFDPRMVGTWISVEDQSFLVRSFTDDQHVKLTMPDGSAITTGDELEYSANAVPMPIRNAILYLASHRYETREPVITGRGITSVEIASTVDDLLAPYKVYA